MQVQAGRCGVTEKMFEYLAQQKFQYCLLVCSYFREDGGGSLHERRIRMRGPNNGENSWNACAARVVDDAGYGTQYMQHASLTQHTQHSRSTRSVYVTLTQHSRTQTILTQHSRSASTRSTRSTRSSYYISPTCDMNARTSC